MKSQGVERPITASTAASRSVLAWRVLDSGAESSEGSVVRVSQGGWYHLMNLPGMEGLRAVTPVSGVNIEVVSGDVPPAGGGWQFATDMQTQQRLEALLLNANGRHFLGNARYGPLARRWPERVRMLHAFLRRQGLAPCRVVFDSSLVLELYGLRAARDVDFLSLDPPRERERGFSANDGQLLHHRAEKARLVEDPDCHLAVDGLRFVSFDEVRRLKRGRNRFKDRNDLRMMEALERGDLPGLWLGGVVARWVVVTIVLEHWIRRLGRGLGRRF